MRALMMKHKNDSPKRDAVLCVAAAAYGRPMTGTDVFMVFRNLDEGMQMTLEQWQLIMQELVEAKGMKREAANEWLKQMATQGNPNAMDLANAMHQTVDVKLDGNLAARHGQVVPTMQKPDDAMGLLEMSRNFWVALFKLHQDKKLQDGSQRDLAQLLKNVGQKYVRTGRNADLTDASVMDARANRFLIKKLQTNPTIRADEAKMAALEKLAKAEATGRAPTPKELIEIFEALGKGVPMTPEMLRTILEYMIASMKA